MLSLDTETTGLDFRHGAMPFFATMCDENGNQSYWEWDVDPLTRRVKIPSHDLQEIASEIESAIGRGESIILQNSKFDFTALYFAGLWEYIDVNHVWGAVQDTLIAGHLLASNLPHNLTDMATQYLGVDIEPYEKELKRICDECRRYCRSHFPEWQIAKAGRPDMPSAKDSCWKYDTWLPKALADHLGHPTDHPYRSVLREYANADSAVTVALMQEQMKEIRRRKLDKIFTERMKCVPVAYKMEMQGVSINPANLNKLVTEYEQESYTLGERCINIARSYNYELDLPAGGANNSLRTFMFDVLKLEHVKNPKAKTDAPTLNKGAMSYYASSLSEKSKAGLFIKSLLAKRSRDTALTYMKSYNRFWSPIEGQEESFYRLHPYLNPTGTATLRWSSSNPNEQNISKREGFNIRFCFGPSPGREWWSLDAKNIELRIPAYEAGEDEMVALFERSDDPPYYGSNHMLIFHILWPELWNAALKEVGPEKVASYCKKKYASTQHQWTKNGNFAVQYGAVDREDGMGTADRAYHLPGAQARIAKRFAKMDHLNKRMIRNAEKYGYVETMPDKTVDPERGYPLMCTRTEWGKILPTVPLNYHVQGTACWWMLKAMVRCQQQLDEWNRTFSTHGGYHLVMQVHDELVFDFPKRADPRTDPKRSNLSRIRIIQKTMTQGGDDIGVPTPVSCEYHPDNWSEGIGV